MVRVAAKSCFRATAATSSRRTPYLPQPGQARCHFRTQVLRHIAYKLTHIVKPYFWFGVVVLRDTVGRRARCNARQRVHWTPVRGTSAGVAMQRPVGPQQRLDRRPPHRAPRASPAARPIRRCADVAARSSAKRLKYAGVGQRMVVGDPLFITCEPDAGDAWRLERIAKLLQDGGIGIIPTDSLPAVVCDLQNRDAVLRLYAAMQLSPKKQLSVLCRSFQDISHYTGGFRPPTLPGQPDTFTVVRRMLPGPFTLIMPASKNLPPITVDVERGRKQQRKSVGVRMPDDPVCRALLEDFGGCLLSHSVHVPEHLDNETEVPDPGTLMDMYGNTGIDFIVDTGPRVATASTVIDLTGVEPELVRQGKGDASPLLGS
ncbi:MAG: DHBP synthase RibB-like alpha/beta domain-containing protein, partial [Monoraphidium minutum]